MNLLAAILLCQAQADPVITHNYGIIRGDLLVEAVAKEAGLSWKAAGGLKQELIYANLKGLAASKAKKALAEIVGGKWTARDGYELLTSPTTESSPFEAELKRSVRRYFTNTTPPGPLSKQDMDGIIRKSQEQPSGQPNEQTYREAQKLSREAPAPRALAKVILALGADAILNLKAGERFVFAENPTRMQLALPPAAKSAFSDLRRELPYFSQAISLAAEKDPTSNSVFQPLSPMEGGTTKMGPIYIVISKEEFFTQATLNIYDPAGSSLIYTDTTGVGLDPDSMMMDFEEMASGARKDPFEEFKKPIELSPEGFKRLEMLSQPFTKSPEARSTPSPEVVEFVTHMDKTEPLSYVLSEPLDKFCEVYNRGLLTVVPDMALATPMQDMGPNGKAEKLTYGSLLKFVALNWFGLSTSKTETVDGTLVISNPTAQDGRTARFDRAAASRLAKDYLEGRSQIDALADFSLTVTDVAASMVCLQALNSVLGARFQIAGGASLDALRIYGGLNQSQKLQAAKGGIQLNLSALSPGMSSAAGRLIFGYSPWVEAPAKPTPEDKESDQETALSAPDLPWSDVDPEDQRVSEIVSGRGPSGLNEEVTVALGNGVPFGSTVTIQLSRQSRVYGYQSSETNYKMLMMAKPEELAWQAAWREKQPENEAYRLDRFVQGLQEILSVQFDYPKTGKMLRGYVGESIDPKSPFFGESGLPPDFQDRYNKALKQARESVKNMEVGAEPPPGGPKRPPTR